MQGAQRSNIKRGIYALAIITLVALLFQGVQFMRFLNERDARVDEIGEQTTARLRDQVDTLLQTIVIEGDRLAELFGSQEFTSTEIDSIIAASTRSIPEL